MAHGDPPAGQHALHSCGVKLCINPRHLRWGTRSENMLDHWAERPRNSDRDMTILARWRAGETQSAIAADVGISQSRVSTIIKTAFSADHAF